MKPEHAQAVSAGRTGQQEAGGGLVGQQPAGRGEDDPVAAALGEPVGHETLGAPAPAGTPCRVRRASMAASSPRSGPAQDLVAGFGDGALARRGRCSGRGCGRSTSGARPGCGRGRRSRSRGTRPGPSRGGCGGTPGPAGPSWRSRTRGGRRPTGRRRPPGTCRPGRRRRGRATSPASIRRASGVPGLDGEGVGADVGRVEGQGRLEGRPPVRRRLPRRAVDEVDVEVVEAGRPGGRHGPFDAGGVVGAAEGGQHVGGHRLHPERQAVHAAGPVGGQELGGRRCRGCTPPSPRRPGRGGRRRGSRPAARRGAATVCRHRRRRSWPAGRACVSRRRTRSVTQAAA